MRNSVEANRCRGLCLQERRVRLKENLQHQELSIYSTQTTILTVYLSSVTLLAPPSTISFDAMICNHYVVSGTSLSSSDGVIGITVALSPPWWPLFTQCTQKSHHYALRFPFCSCIWIEYYSCLFLLIRWMNTLHLLSSFSKPIHSVYHFITVSSWLIFI